MSNLPSWERIINVAWGFTSAKTLLTGVELGLFTLLGDKSMSGTDIARSLKLHPEKIFDFLDTLLSLQFLERQGDGIQGLYRNTPETACYLDQKSPHYRGGLLEMASKRLYRYWNDLPEALRTGTAQSEIKNGEERLFDTMYQDESKLEIFADAMSGLSKENFMSITEKFDFGKYKTHCDLGGSSALFSTIIAQHYPDIQCTSFDLPPLGPIAQRRIEKAGLVDRVRFQGGDFIQQPLPQAEIITMGLILHDWGLADKKLLIKKTYEALPQNGAFMVIEHLIDDERRSNSFGLLMSLNMLIEFGSAFDYSFQDFKTWCSEAGFVRFEKITLAGPCSAAIAYKN